MTADELKPRAFAWENLDRLNPERSHYSVLRLSGGEGGMDALRDMFPEPVANEMNFVLFSTSGVHGSYEPIEDAENVLRNGPQDDEEGVPAITFLIVQPRIVGMRYGVCEPQNMDDIDFLKRLRASSKEAVCRIGGVTG